jgi:hypothetical protein
MFCIALYIILLCNVLFHLYIVCYFDWDREKQILTNKKRIKNYVTKLLTTGFHRNTCTHSDIKTHLMMVPSLKVKSQSIT